MESKNYLKTTRLVDLYNWDVKNYFRQFNVFKEGVRIVNFGFFLKKSKIEKIKIEDNKEYKILGVRSYGKGAYVNRIVKGSSLKMKIYQLASKNRLFWCKVDTKNGAFGVINEEMSDGLGSTNMTFADIDCNKASTDYVQILFKSTKVNNYMDSFVTGTTNRKYIKPNQLLEEIKIPLPLIEEQNRIVKTYNTKITLAEKQEQKAKDLEQEIEDYLFDALGIEKLKKKEVKKGLQFVSFQNLERWDILSNDLRILNSLKSSKYKLKRIGNVYSFPSKSWKKSEHKTKNFRYIELGAIDIVEGVKEVKNIEVAKAPSRATQQVKKGDLIIGTTRPYLKRFAIIQENNHLDICSSGFSIIEPSSEYDLRYLKEFLFSYYGIEQLKNRMTGATYPAITNSELKEILTPLPKIKIQKKIADHISKLKDKIKTLKEESKHNREQAILDFEKEIFNIE